MNNMTKSEILYERAIKVTPWGTQTNAKRPVLEYKGAMPFYIERGKGCRLWDVDGREYIDYRCSLGPTILGYCYDEVDEAVRKQMEKGVLFSMASPIEIELAELIHEMVPGAEMVKFMKTGEDANSCCVRLARAFTGKDMIISCGYHGYPDWFMTHIYGVPAFMSDYVKKLDYGNFEQAEEIISKYADKTACVITVPYDLDDNLSADYLKHLRKLTEEYKIPLIFDEVITGFRLAKGGAQEYYGVIPDLAAFAKAIANGYPLSAFAGKKEYMELLNTKTLITTTYAGETLSIAAAIATLRIMKREDVHGHIFRMGKKLKEGYTAICKNLRIEGYGAGLEPLSYINFIYNDPEINNKLNFHLMHELYKNGIFANVRSMISYSHQEKDIDITLEKTEIALKRAKEIVGV